MDHKVSIMKNLIYLFSIVFTFQMSTAQLTVKGDSFIYSKGTDIFVTEEINLEDADSKLYLREEAQLIQEDNTPNEGAGLISLFQEGTSNEYSYNYWSSPVSNQSTGIDGNVGFKNSQIKYPTVDTGAAITPTTTNYTTTSGDSEILSYNTHYGQSDDGNINGTPLRIAGRWLWTYDSGGNATTGYAGWSIFNGAQTNKSGYGFTMKGVIDNGTLNNGTFNAASGQRYDFRGRPNNGTIYIGVGNDNATLAGNPYPSALDLKKFIEVNAGNQGGLLVNDVKMDPWVEFWVSQEESSHMLTSYLGGYGRYVPLGFAKELLTGEFTTTGTYQEAVFRRTNNDGSINLSTPVGGPPPPPGGPLGSTNGNITPDGKRRYVAIGQGFFISRTNTAVDYSENINGIPDTFEQAATTNISPGINGGILGPGITGEAIEFNNSMRVFQREDGDTSLFKVAPSNTDPQSAVAASQIPKMIINVVPNGLYARPLSFIFDDSTSQDYDYAWEGPISGRINTDAYIQIGTSGEYGLSSQAFDENMAIPLGIQVASSFTAPIDVEFEIAYMANFDPANVYLHDLQTETYHDIKDGNKTLLIESGHYTDRFEITFKDTSSTLGSDLVEATNFDVFQNNGTRELTVLNPNLKKVAKISLYDLAGRLVFSEKLSSTQASYIFDTASLSSAIYITKITTQDSKETTAKVSVSN
ncbi:MAG: hypothetical protein ACI9IZ_001876 [Nonlabens sp.]